MLERIPVAGTHFCLPTPVLAHISSQLHTHVQLLALMSLVCSTHLKNACSLSECEIWHHCRIHTAACCADTIATLHRHTYQILIDILQLLHKINQH